MSNNYFGDEHGADVGRDPSTTTAPSVTSSTSAAPSASTSAQGETTYFLEEKPWVWVVFPLLLVVVVGVLGVVLRVKRTQQRRAAEAAAARLTALDSPSLDPRARALLQRQIAAELARARGGGIRSVWPPPPGDASVAGGYAFHGVGGGVTTHAVPGLLGGITVMTVPRSAAAAAGGAGRWGWASGHAVAPRLEEGLNELGEAPPPYAGGKDPAEGEMGGEAVELRDLGRAQSGASRGSGSGSGSRGNDDDENNAASPSSSHAAGTASPTNAGANTSANAARTNTSAAASPRRPSAAAVPAAPATFVLPPPYSAQARNAQETTAPPDPLAELMRGPTRASLPRERIP